MRAKGAAGHLEGSVKVRSVEELDAQVLTAEEVLEANATLYDNFTSHCHPLPGVVCSGEQHFALRGGGMVRRHLICLCSKKKFVFKFVCVQTCLYSNFFVFKLYHSIFKYHSIFNHTISFSNFISFNAFLFAFDSLRRTSASSTAATTL